MPEIINSNKILCVDLDGTFIKSDMLFESFFYCFFRDPLILFICFFWLLTGGKRRLKEQLAKRYHFNAEVIPLNKEVVKLIKEKKSSGYEICLVSASWDSIVKSFFLAYPDLFDRYFATSDDKNNLAGNNKADFLTTLFPQGFEYVGNSKADMPVWNKSKKAYCIVKNGRLLKDLVVDYEKLTTDPKPSLFKLILKQIRIHQWAKNTLIILPVVAAHEMITACTALLLTVSFFSFSFVTSSVYIINDLLDLDNDRSHSTKKNRPLASCNLSLVQGVALLLIFLSAGLTSAYLISPIFGLLTAGYLVFNLLYSLYLKSIDILDCVTLSIMYTYRIFLGTIVCDLKLSVWMLSFSFFLFLSLAFVKRYAELFNAHKQNKTSSKGRGYHTEDMPVILAMAVGSGFLSVLVYDLYLNDDSIKESFKAIWFAYMSIPVLLYWLARIFIRSARGQMNEDPVAYALKDRVSICLGFIFVLLFWLGASSPW